MLRRVKEKQMLLEDFPGVDALLNFFLRFYRVFIRFEIGFVTLLDPVLVLWFLDSRRRKVGKTQKNILSKLMSKRTWRRKFLKTL